MSYDTRMALEKATVCQNGIELNARRDDLSPRLSDLRLQVVGLIPQIASLRPGFLKIAASTRRFAPATRQFEAANCRVETRIFEISGFKTPIRSRESTGSGDRSPVRKHPLAPHSGCVLSQSCPMARRNAAGPHSTISCICKGENHGKIPNQRTVLSRLNPGSVL